MRQSLPGLAKAAARGLESSRDDLACMSAFSICEMVDNLRKVKADALIGELNGGKFYVNQRNKVGRLTGKAVIFRNRQDAFDYLLRNRYV